MSQQFPGENLSPFEARLAELMPKAVQIGRDEILFEAGRQDAYRQQRHFLYKWYAACAVLMVVVCAQWIWLPGDASHSGAPVIAEVSPSVETPNTPSNSQLAQEKSKPSLPSSDVQTGSNSVAHAAPSSRSPSIWEQLIPLPTTAPSVIALGHDLSVGSSVRGISYEAFATPKPGSIPADDEPILSPMHRMWLAE